MSINSIEQAVILTGGRGRRLMPLTADRNKGMVEVSGSPFLHYLVKQLGAQGIRRILFLTGYQAESIQRYFGSGEDYGVSIYYDHQPEEINHGTRLSLASNRIDDYFLLVKNDILWPFNLKRHLEVYNRALRPVMMTVYLNSNKDGIYGPMSNIAVKDNDVIAYDELSTSEDYLGQDLGYLVCCRKTLEDWFPHGDFSLHDGGLLSILAKQNLLSAFLTKTPAVTITDASYLDSVRHYLSMHTDL
jgi:NDP-sugar pyrophosphorylase family protein